MAKSSKDYFGLSRIVSLILAVLVGGILGIVVRFMENKPIAGIVRLLIAFTGVGFVALNVIDFIMILLNGKILRVINK